MGRGDSGPAKRSARAGARAPAQLRPKAGDGAGARGDDAVAAGPTRHRERKGGNDDMVDSGANRPFVGRTRPPVGSAAIRRRFLDNG